MSKLLKLLRRVPERKRPPRCKRGFNCPVDAAVQLHCPGCRFAKCLRKETFENIFHRSFSFQGWNAVEPSADAFPTQGAVRESPTKETKTGEERSQLETKSSALPLQAQTSPFQDEGLREENAQQSVKLSTKTTLWRAIPPQWRSPPPQSQRLHPVQESLSCSCHFLR